MLNLTHRKLARPDDLGLTPGEYAVLARLGTAPQIQRFLNRIAPNREVGGETLLSVRQVLGQRRAHCIEAAFVAACALWIHGKPPLVMHLDCAPTDYPHVVALFKDNRCWGAISKSQSGGLGYRDPVYRSLRELAMSYFHEYFDKRGRRTLRTHSVAFELRQIDASQWVTSTEPCVAAHDRLERLRHYRLIGS